MYVDTYVSMCNAFVIKHWMSIELLVLRVTKVEIIKPMYVYDNSILTEKIEIKLKISTSRFVPLENTSIAIDWFIRKTRIRLKQPTDLAACQ